MQLYLIRIILSQSFLYSKHLFIVATVRSYIIVVRMGAILHRRVGSNTPPYLWEKFFTVDIFKKSASNCAKRMIVTHVYDTCVNLNQIC